MTMLDMKLARTAVVGSCAGLTALTLAVDPTEAAATRPPPPRSVLQSQGDAIIDAGAPGVSIAVHDEHGDWSGVAGVGDIATRSQPDPRGEFRIGSITKTFTATMVLQLVAEGRIELGTDVTIARCGPSRGHQPLLARNP